MDADARADLIALGLVPGLGPTLMRRAMSRLGSPVAVRRATMADLTQIRGIGHQRASQISAGLAKLADGRLLASKQRMLEQHRVIVLVETEPDYPPLLRHIPDPPPLVCVRGRLDPDDAVALAIGG